MNPRSRFLIPEKVAHRGEEPRLEISHIFRTLPGLRKKGCVEERERESEVSKYFFLFFFLGGPAGNLSNWRKKRKEQKMKMSNDFGLPKPRVGEGGRGKSREFGPRSFPPLSFSPFWQIWVTLAPEGTEKKIKGILTGSSSSTSNRSFCCTKNTQLGKKTKKPFGGECRNFSHPHKKQNTAKKPGSERDVPRERC